MSGSRVLTEEEYEARLHAFASSIAFNAHLNLQPMEIDGELVRFRFPMRSELVGHPDRRVLHGGVISSCLDVAGSMAAFLGVLRQHETVDEATLNSVLGRLATIDMRVDYLRPGQGEAFIATGFVVRAGKKVAVARMTLTNELSVELAVGTATYIVG